MGSPFSPIISLILPVAKSRISSIWKSLSWAVVKPKASMTSSVLLA